MHKLIGTMAAAVVLPVLAPVAMVATAIQPLEDAANVLTSAAHADPVEDRPGGAYVKAVDTRPAGPAIRVTLANDRGQAIRSDILRPCRFEDGRRCYWIGSEMGNGRGSDFIVTAGHVFRMDLSWIGGQR